jgi:hypothetical protein
MLIGLFGFYAKWIPWYEDLVVPWRAILKKKPPVDTSVEDEALKLKGLWNSTADALLTTMKDAILSRPVLKRPDWNRPFFVKTDWSSFAKGGALCQAECTPQAEEALKDQSDGHPSVFDKTISGLRLRPLQFISKRNSVSERSYHSSVGELSTGRWAFLKWTKYLWFKPFWWLTDCIGIINFWEIDYLPTHQCQRWKMDMMRYDFTAIHRPEQMLCECNLLSRYNHHAERIRAQETASRIARDDIIQARLDSGVNPNKGVRNLAAEHNQGAIP